MGLSVHRGLRQGPNQRERSVRHRRPGNEHDLREAPEEELLLLYIIIEVAEGVILTKTPLPPPPASFPKNANSPNPSSPYPLSSLIRKYN